MPVPLAAFAVHVLLRWGGAPIASPEEALRLAAGAHGDVELTFARVELLWAPQWDVSRPVRIHFAADPAYVLANSGPVENVWGPDPGKLLLKRADCDAACSTWLFDPTPSGDGRIKCAAATQMGVTNWNAWKQNGNRVDLFNWVREEQEEVAAASIWSFDGKGGMIAFRHNPDFVLTNWNAKAADGNRVDLYNYK